MKESELTSYAVTRFKQAGVFWYRMPLGAVMHSIGGKVVRKKNPLKGFPDYAGLFQKGRMWAAEIKAGKAGKLSPEQVDWITRLNHAGAMAVVLRTREEIDSFVEAIKN
jgi:hypothetical protein